MASYQEERKQEKEEKGKRYHRVERSYGSFVRSFSLPDLVDEEKVKAEYGDYEVVMLRWTKIPDCRNLFLKFEGGDLHIEAQSMKGFYRYVYQHPDGDWDTSAYPTMQWDKDITLQPIAVLFTKDSE